MIKGTLFFRTVTNGRLTVFNASFSDINAAIDANDLKERPLGEIVSKQYHEFLLLFGKVLVDRLAPRRPGIDHEVRLKEWETPMWVVLATGPGKLPAVRVRTAHTVQLGSKPIQKPNQLHLGGPNPDSYPSTHAFCRVWLDPSVPISSSSFRVFLFMVAFRYPIPNRKILTLVYRCPFLMYWPPF